MKLIKRIIKPPTANNNITLNDSVDRLVDSLITSTAELRKCQSILKRLKKPTNKLT